VTDAKDGLLVENDFGISQDSVVTFLRCGGQHSMLTGMSNFFRTLYTENYFKSAEFNLKMHD